MERPDFSARECLHQRHAGVFGRRDGLFSPHSAGRAGAADAHELSLLEALSHQYSDGDDAGDAHYPGKHRHRGRRRLNSEAQRR